MASTRTARRWFAHETRCRSCGRRFSVYGTPWGCFVRLAPGEARGEAPACRDVVRDALAASLQAMEADALLEYLRAPRAERDRIVLRALNELASARLDEATLQEALDEAQPRDRRRDPDLPERLAAARARVVAGARMLLRMRAASAAGDLAM